MKKLIRLCSLLAVMAVLLTSCTDEDTAGVIIDNNPYALNNASEITGVLTLLSQNPTDCLSLNYPVTIAAYTGTFEVGETFTINSDTELAALLSGFTEGESYAFQYPVSITGFDDAQVTINSNEDFVTAIQAQRDACQAAACDTTNTVFTQAFTAIANLENTEESFSGDVWTHEFTFSVAHAGTICSIGYMAESRPEPIVYLIQLIDSNGNVAYTGNHSFSATQMEYISIPPVNINADENYTLRRSIASYDVGQGLGRMVSRSQNLGAQPPLLPFTQGDITIKYSGFYGGGGNEGPDYYALPYIDFVFKPL